MEILRQKENHVYVHVGRGEVVGTMVVLAVTDSNDNYIQVTIEEAKEKYNYQPIEEDNGISENEV